MSWWRHIRQQQRVSRELHIPNVDRSSIPAFSYRKPHRISQTDLSVMKKLEEELIRSGVLDRTVEEKFVQADDADEAFEAAGDRGVAHTSALPSYDSELDALISSVTGGENLLLDGEDDYDIYQTKKTIGSTNLNQEDGFTFRLPDRAITRDFRSQ